MLVGGKYRLTRPAGFGGMGAVWVARNEATNAEVAVKILVTSKQGVDEEQILRFRREAHAAAQLYHRGIVRIFDLVELNTPGEEALVLVMELLRGETLASHMDAKRRFTLEETMAIVLPLLSALAHAHAQGIVHRDLKPDNVFLVVDPDGHVIPKILDFGISKLMQPAAPKITTDGSMLGTPNYMSPEQARGQADVDARSDVFAAGILVYEMLSGVNPVAHGSYHSVVAAILERDPAPLSQVDPEVWRVIKRALEKSAMLRYTDASDLGAALQKAATAAGVKAPDQSGGYPAPRVSVGDRSVPPAPFRESDVTIPSMFAKEKRRSRRRTAILGGIVVAACLLGAGLCTRPSRLPATSAQSASQPAAPPGATLEVAPSAAPDPTAAVAASATSAPAAAASQASGAPGPVHIHTQPPPHGNTTHPTKPAPSAPSAPAKSGVVRDPGF